MPRGGTRGKSSGSFMRECITGILGPGMAAFDAHFATKRFITCMKVSRHMQENELLAPSSRSILAGWRTVRTPSTWRSFRIVPACEMRCGIEPCMLEYA